jgi:hypothetical protein
MNYDAKTYRLNNAGNVGRIALTVGIVGLALAAIGLFTDREHFFFAYLTAFTFWVTIALGALFFTMLHHLTGAMWSVVVRRIVESLMAPLPWLFLLFIPILFGLHEIYHWSHADLVASDALLQKKAGYLNPTFFGIRAVIYFVVWSGLAHLLYKTSISQDSGHREEHTKRMRAISAPGMIVFAITTTLAGFDWLMSLDPHWYSTIFGVYFFAGGLWTVLAVITLVAILLRQQGILRDQITVEHYHDLGKLMFAFTIFWTYIGFSQYFLQWYANIPEETTWYLARWVGSWKAVSMVILFGHFVIPFTVMIFRAVKRSVPALRILTIYFLVMHWVDHYWMALPTLYKNGAHFSWIEIATTIGIGGIFVWAFWSKFTRQPIIPVADPKLEESINFKNM